MADGLQAFTSATQLVTLTCDLINFVQKIRRVKPEADKWLKRIEDLRILAVEIRNELAARIEDREHGYVPSQHGEAIETSLKDSLVQCVTAILQMKQRVSRLADLDENFTMRSLPDRIKFIADERFIERQQNELRLLHQNISVAFHLIDQHDRRLERAERRRDQADRRRQEAYNVELLSLLRQNVAQTQGLTSDTSIQERDREDIPANPVLPSEARSSLTEVHSIEAPPQQARLGNHEALRDVDQLLEQTTGNRSDYDAFLTQRQPRANVLEAACHPLMVAVMRQNLDSVKGQLRQMHDEEICVVDEDQWTLLHHAALRDSPDMLGTLLVHSQLCTSEYINKQNWLGQTALMEAAKRANHDRGLQMMQLLLEQKCDVNIRDGEGCSAIYWVVEHTPDPEGCSVKAADLLLDQHVQLEPLKRFCDDVQIRKYPRVKESLERTQPDRRQTLGDKIFGTKGQ